MAQYTYETQLETTGDILMLAQGNAKEFHLSKYKFTKNKKQAEFSCVYTIQFNIDAPDFREALEIANKDMRVLEDALAFYYSMPVVWLWWNWSLSKRDEEPPHLLVSLYKKIPGVVMDSYDVPPTDAIEGLIELINKDEGFANSAYYYNSLARLDTLELARAHLPVMFQLVESTADKEDVEACDVCGKSGYKKTSHSHIKSFLGNGLHDELYSHRESGEDTVRNATMHGNPNSPSTRPITHGHIEDVLKKVRAKLIDEHNLTEVDKGKDRVDIARYYYDREGAVLPVAPIEGWELEDYVNDFAENGIEKMTPKISKIDESSW